MNKKLQKALKDANKELKKQGFFKNYQIDIDGDFTSEYNFIELSHDGHQFPIATVASESEAIAAISGYITGLGHGEDKSYPKFMDKAA